MTIQAVKDLKREYDIPEVSDSTIDKAFLEMIDQRNYFDHWHTRLRRMFCTEDYNFAKELLNVVSENASIEANEIHDLAVKHKVEANYKGIVDSLKYDGYINKDVESKTFRFNSPILKLWWYNNVAN